MQIERIDNGGIHTPAGFRIGSAACGIKTTPGKQDVALILCDGPASAAGTFTTNLFAAAPVQWCRSILPAADLRAVAVNAGNANACTGEQGHRDTARTAELVARMADCRPRQVAVASTGIIGHPLPMDRLEAGLRDAFGALDTGAERARQAERAIMTTDTVPKATAVRVQTPAGTYHVGGMAKGSGMIAPNMATMLAFVTTDAALPHNVLQQVAGRVTERTFNRVTVDGDTSTNDSLLVLAGGASCVRVDAELLGTFEQALETVLTDLCRMIARDGEGANRLIEVCVSGADTEHDAVQVARAVGESLLFKCAAAGGDPNWGRIVCAAGYSGANIVPETTTVHLGSVCVVRGGTPTGKDASAPMQAEEVVVRIDLGQGEAEARVLSCDLTKKYVEINAEYHT
jgi:glutamate N-acetyltransferase/amino-acid N-acetyltransferase